MLDSIMPLVIGLLEHSITSMTHAIQDGSEMGEQGVKDFTAAARSLVDAAGKSVPLTTFPIITRWFLIRMPSMLQVTEPSATFPIVARWFLIQIA